VSPKIVMLTPSRDLAWRGTAARDRGSWITVGTVIGTGTIFSSCAGRLSAAGLPVWREVFEEVASCHFVREGNPTMIRFTTIR
jgi:hypothetical protein